MPISKYYKGHGNQVMENMLKEYGPQKGKSVFYATANKMGMTAKGAKPNNVSAKMKKMMAGK